VNSDAVISSLVEKGLVREAGRDSGPGNAILYATTRTFLEKFGLRSLRDLPPLEDFAPDEQSREYIRARLSAGESSARLGGGGTISAGDDDDDDDDDGVGRSGHGRDGDGDDADGDDARYSVATEESEEDLELVD
jgi:segregation and condensation protein B